MFSTGTGIAPFSSIIKDPEVYDLYDNLILVHGCRQVAELQYGFDIVKAARDNEFFGEVVQEKLIHYPTVTREPYKYQGRTTDLIEYGKLFADIGQPPLNPAEDRVMICGSPGLLSDLVKTLRIAVFAKDRAATPPLMSSKRPSSTNKRDAVNSPTRIRPRFAAGAAPAWFCRLAPACP